MKNAKIAAAITAAVAAVLAVLGKAFNFGVDTTTQILMHFGYDWGRAAARAPFYFSISLGLTGILACIGWIISEDARHRLWKRWSKPRYSLQMLDDFRVRVQHRKTHSNRTRAVLDAETQAT